MYIIAIAAVVSGFMACTGANAPASTADDESVDSVDIELMDEESEADSTASTTRGASDSEGFGRCAESGCYCKEFKGRGQTCQNCGHAYRRHY